MAERPMEHFTVDGVNIFEVTDAQARQDVNNLKEDYTTILGSAYVTDTASGAIASFTDGAEDMPVKSLTVDIEPVQSGSGDPSPDNVRPISGHTQAVVTRTGKNLFPAIDGASYTGSYITMECDGGEYTLTVGNTDLGLSTIMSDSAVDDLLAGKKVIPAGTYACSIVVSQWGSEMALIPERLRIELTDNVTGETIRIVNGLSATLAHDSTISQIHFDRSYSMHAHTVTKFSVQLELGSTATPYEPYNAQTVTIDWTTEAGTVYGGTLDVTTGVLTVTKAKVIFNSSNGFSATVGDSTAIFSKSNAVADVPTETGEICNILEFNARAYEQTTPHPNTFVLGGSKTLYIQLDKAIASSLDEFGTFLTNNPVEVCYTLTTPMTITLTPAQLTTLLGQNNVWADTGDVEVNYRADTKLYIEKLTAPTEDDMVADHAISANTFFMAGNSLYRATTAIASGATITVGTNATKLSLSDALNALA